MDYIDKPFIEIATFLAKVLVVFAGILVVFSTTFDFKEKRKNKKKNKI